MWYWDSYCFWSGLLRAEVELGQVVVTATRTEVEISDSPQPISVITKEEIMNLNHDPDIGHIFNGEALSY